MYFAHGRWIVEKYYLNLWWHELLIFHICSYHLEALFELLEKYKVSLNMHNIPQKLGKGLK